MKTMPANTSAPHTRRRIAVLLTILGMMLAGCTTPTANHTSSPASIPASTMNTETTSEFLYTFSPKNFREEWVKKSYVTERCLGPCWQNDSGTIYVFKGEDLIQDPPEMVVGGSMGHELVVFGEHFRTYLHSELEVDKNGEEHIIIKIALGMPVGPWNRDNMKRSESDPWRYVRTCIHPVFLQSGAEIESYYANKIPAEQLKKSKQLIRQFYQHTSIVANLSKRNQFYDKILNEKINTITKEPISDERREQMLMSRISSADPFAEAKKELSVTPSASPLNDRLRISKTYMSDVEVKYIGTLAH